MQDWKTEGGIYVRGTPRTGYDIFSMDIPFTNSRAENGMHIFSKRDPTYFLNLYDQVKSLEKKDQLAELRKGGLNGLIGLVSLGGLSYGLVNKESVIEILVGGIITLAAITGGYIVGSKNVRNAREKNKVEFQKDLNRQNRNPNSTGERAVLNAFKAPGRYEAELKSVETHL